MTEANGPFRDMRDKTVICLRHRNVFLTHIYTRDLVWVVLKRRDMPVTHLDARPYHTYVHDLHNWLWLLTATNQTAAHWFPFTSDVPVNYWKCTFMTCAPDFDSGAPKHTSPTHPMGTPTNTHAHTWNRKPVMKQLTGANKSRAPKQTHKHNKHWELDTHTNTHSHRPVEALWVAYLPKVCLCVNLCTGHLNPEHILPCSVCMRLSYVLIFLKEV